MSVEVGPTHRKPNVQWAVQWDEGRAVWLIHRNDGAGGVCMAQRIEFERSPPIVSNGRALVFHAELLVNGMTCMSPNGQQVAVDVARFRYCKPSKQAVAVEVIRMKASSTMGG